MAEVFTNCPRCGSAEFNERSVHDGASTQRTCKRCGCFMGWGKWYGVTSAARANRHNKNAQAGGLAAAVESDADNSWPTDEGFSLAELTAGESLPIIEPGGTVCRCGCPFFWQDRSNQRHCIECVPWVVFAMIAKIWHVIVDEGEPYSLDVSDLLMPLAKCQDGLRKKALANKRQAVEEKQRARNKPAF